MQTASSARRTCSAAESAVEKTATVLMPISWQARMIRTAISPRLAINILLNILIGFVTQMRAMHLARLRIVNVGLLADHTVRQLGRELQFSQRRRRLAI